MKHLARLYHLQVGRIDHVDTRVTLVVNATEKMRGADLVQDQLGAGIVLFGLAQAYRYRLTGRQREYLVEHRITVDKSDVVTLLYCNKSRTHAVIYNLDNLAAGSTTDRLLPRGRLQRNGHGVTLRPAVGAEQATIIDRNRTLYLGSRKRLQAGKQRHKGHKDSNFRFGGHAPIIMPVVISCLRSW